MSRVSIRTRGGEFHAVLDDSDVSNAIWLSGSLKLDVNMLGGMVYGDFPLDIVPPEGERVTKLKKGDVAYWPRAGALCMFYGPTPLSGEDGDPVAPFPVVKIGEIEGDCSGLERAGDRQTIRIVAEFRRDRSGYIRSLHSRSRMADEIRLLIHDSPEGPGYANVVVKDGDVWITKAAMAELFGVNESEVSRHMSDIRSERELDGDRTVTRIETVRSEAGRDLGCHDLDMAISVGYRADSRHGADFRTWATGVLKEYAVKGFVLDDGRLKNNSKLFGRDYFDELLERVRSIRASERRVWQKITDIFAECSIDYDSDPLTAKRFHDMVRDKFHYAVTGRTAAELVFDRADHTATNMGLTAWENAPDGMIRKSDVRIARNYLEEDQIRQLERAVSEFFDFIEDMIERGHVFSMDGLTDSVDRFLEFHGYRVLDRKGSVSEDTARNKAESEYEIFKNGQRYISDFDRYIEGSMGK